MNYFNNPILKHIPSKTLEELMENNKITIKLYKKGRTIHFENDLCTHLEIILEGSVTIDRIDEAGNLFSVSSFIKGDILGGNLLFAKTPSYPMSVAAKSDVKILELEKNILFKLLSDYPNFLKAYLENLSDNAFILGDRIRAYEKRTIRQILLSYLEKQSQLQKNNKIALNITKKELAQIIGVQRTSLSRELAKMKHDGLILYDKNFIELL